MNDDAYKVTVARDLEDLIPGFMRNRNKELQTLKLALAAADFEQLRQLGHRMKGVGNSYGFAHVSVLGQEIEDGRSEEHTSELQSRVDLVCRLLLEKKKTSGKASVPLR